jgi:hypothetical protein
VQIKSVSGRQMAQHSWKVFDEMVAFEGRFQTLQLSVSLYHRLARVFTRNNFDILHESNKIYYNFCRVGLHKFLDVKITFNLISITVYLQY